MSNRRFIELIRQYRLLSQRQRKSFAEQVNAVVALRAAQVREDIQDADAQDAALRKMTDMVMREYAPADPGFVIEAGS
jgi:hypothetical protein